jgi:hypothetical protein
VDHRASALLADEPKEVRREQRLVDGEHSRNAGSRHITN